MEVNTTLTLFPCLRQADRNLLMFQFLRNVFKFVVIIGTEINLMSYLVALGGISLVCTKVFC